MREDWEELCVEYDGEVPGGNEQSAGCQKARDSMFFMADFMRQSGVEKIYSRVND